MGIRQNFSGNVNLRDKITIQTSSKDNQSRGVLGYGIESEEVMVSDESLEQLLSGIPKITRSIEMQLDQTMATEAEVTFGLQMTNTGMSITQGLEEANFIFKLKWENNRQ